MTPEEPEALLSMFALPGGSRQLETPKSPRPTCDSYVLVVVRARQERWPDGPVSEVMTLW